MHAVGAQRIDRDAQGQRRIDAAGESQHDPRKAVLVDVVARALHQRTVHALFLPLQRNDGAGQRPDHAGRIDLQIDDVHALGERRSPRGHRALAHP